MNKLFTVLTFGMVALATAQEIYPENIYDKLDSGRYRTEDPLTGKTHTEHYQPVKSTQISIKWDTNEIARILSDTNVLLVIDNAPNNRIEIKTEQSTYILQNTTGRLDEIKKILKKRGIKDGHKVSILHLD